MSLAQRAAVEQAISDQATITGLRNDLAALRQANEHLRRENDRLRATSLPVQRSEDE